MSTLGWFPVGRLLAGGLREADLHLELTTFCFALPTLPLGVLRQELRNGHWLRPDFALSCTGYPPKLRIRSTDCLSLEGEDVHGIESGRIDLPTNETTISKLLYVCDR